MEDLKKLYADHKEEFLRDFFTFLKFESIATDPTYKDETEKCADWLMEYLSTSGLQVEKWETDRSPILFATDLRAGPYKETLLLYCHYDVQPVDPLEEWLSPPFEPTIREGEVYARGAVDNKGQCFYTATALRALLKKYNKLPINIKLLIEGEEESGSTSLSQILAEKEEDLKADHILIVDSMMEAPNTPVITLGIRGIVCMDVTVQESQIDLHSGMMGGISYNPNRALCEMLASLKDEHGTITVPGFYDTIDEITPEEKKELYFGSDIAGGTQKMFGFEPHGMEKNLSPQEANWLRPSLEINGIWGGYQGNGFKTVIPARAHAKVSCRLVPGQDPEHIGKLVKEALLKRTPKGVKTEVHIHPGSGAGFRANPNSRIAGLMAQSYTDVFNTPCQKILIGGTIPIAVGLAQVSGGEMILVGLGLPDDLAHAPNEHFGLDRFEQGFLSICNLIELF